MSGRRAAENTNTTRLVPMTYEQALSVGFASTGKPMARWRRDELKDVVVAWDAAPADPAEAAAQRLEEAAGRATLAGRVCSYHEAADAVLAALGLRRQDNPTP